MGKMDFIVGNKVEREPTKGFTVIDVFRTITDRRDPLKVMVLRNDVPKDTAPLPLKFYDGNWNVDTIHLDLKLDPSETTLRVRHMRKIYDMFKHNDDLPVSPELRVFVAGRSMAVVGWDITDDSMILKVDDDA